MAGRDETAEMPLSLIGEYPNRWESSTLGRACSLVTDGTHDSPKETQAGFPLVTGRCITGGRINLNAAYFISERDHKEVVARSKPEFGDILFANIGNSIGEMARVETNAEFSIKNVALFKPGPRLESLFLKYYLLSAPVQSFIRGNTFGSAQPFVGLGTLRAFPIPLPPLVEQKAIVAVPGALDDNIELNRRMNATLEAMARALFQSWFVDFDPVRAKLDGRQPPSLDSATTALFPARFEHTEDGLLPLGWRLAAIEEICDINASTLGKNDHFETLEYVEISAVSRGNITDIATYTRGREPSRARRRLRHGDTVLSTVRPDRGSYFLALNPPENRVASTGFAVLTPTKVPWSFVHAAMTQPDISDHLGQMADGGAYPAVRPEVIGARQVALPNELKILEAFHRTCAPLFDQAEANRTQSRTLATLRDTLLPKLLRGDLSILQTVCHENHH